jgi:hypothetical protein
MNWRNMLLMCFLPCVGGVAATRYFSERLEPSRPAQTEKSEVPAAPKSIAASQAPLSVRLVETGEGFHGDQVNARNGETWLGLYVTESGSALIASRLTVRRVFDPIIDEDERSATGKSVLVGGDDAPVFLVRNAPMLRPGKVVTSFYTAKRASYSLEETPIVTLKLGTQSYFLKLVGSLSGNESLPARFLLTDGVTAQTLYSFLNGDEYADYGLSWAGDLDGDAKLDLYVELSPQENVTERKLFLSSQAKVGQLVAEIAEFVTSGC